MARIQVITKDLETEMAADLEALWGVVPEEKRSALASLAIEASVLNQQYIERGDGLAGFRAADLKLSIQRLRQEKRV